MYNRWRGPHHKDQGMAGGHGGVRPREQDQPHYWFHVRGLQGTRLPASHQEGLRKEEFFPSPREKKKGACFSFLFDIRSWIGGAQTQKSFLPFRSRPHSPITPK